MHRRSTQPIRSGAAPQRRRAFSIVELLIVVSLIIVLLSILAVALNAARSSAQRTNTQTLMNSIKQGLVQFKNDIGYLPPTLTPERDLLWTTFPNSADRLNGPDLSLPDDEYYEDLQRWHSITTLAEYLLGFGSAIEDGAGANHPLPDVNGDTRIEPPFGIRNPGRDGYWSVANQDPLGTLDGRRAFLEDPVANPAALQYLNGRVYGPYIELKDERLLGAIDPDNPPAAGQPWQVFFPGDGGYDPDFPKVICDYWGQPLRYYRRPHPPGAIGQEYRPNMVDPVPSLSDVYVLRPYRVTSGQEVDGIPDENMGVGAEGDTTSTYVLQSAEFAIFSSGPDRQHDQTMRVDPEGFNEDNIVEVGP